MKLQVYDMFWCVTKTVLQYAASLLKLYYRTVRPSGHSFNVHPVTAVSCYYDIYLMNTLNNFDKTDREYSLVPTDDLIRFSRLKVKVT